MAVGEHKYAPVHMNKRLTTDVRWNELTKYTHMVNTFNGGVNAHTYNLAQYAYAL